MRSAFVLWVVLSARVSSGYSQSLPGKSSVDNSNPAGENGAPKTEEVLTTGLSDAIDRTNGHCTFGINPGAITVDVAGGDAHFTAHARLDCPWNSETDAAWLSVTAGQSGTGEGQVALHIAANPGPSRRGTVTIGGVPIPVNQRGADRTWEIPGLSFGPNYWSIVRITNPSDFTRSMKVDIYRESGDRLRIKPVFDLRPEETLEIVIEGHEVDIYSRSSQHPGDLNGPRILEITLAGATPSEGWSWVRISQTREDGIPDFEVRAFKEVVNGNKISDFRMDPKEPLELRSWMIRAPVVRGQTLSFLNVSDQPTNVVFCVANKVRSDPCERKDSFANAFLVQPNQFLVVNVKTFPQKYFFVECSVPVKAILAKFAPAKGTTKVFSSESSIRFGGSSR